MGRVVRNNIYESNTPSENIHSENIQSENIQSENIQSENINSENIYCILEKSKYYNEEEALHSRYNKLDRDNELPKGWVKLFDENSKKYYYACTITN